MKIGKVNVAIASVILLAFQIALVCSIAAKYLYQRWTCPRVWTRAAAFDPSLPMRGRYLSLQLVVDGCQSTLPSAKQAQFPRAFDGTQGGSRYAVRSMQNFQFPARITVQNNKLVALRIPDPEGARSGELIVATPGAPCEEMRLFRPVDFYIPEHAVDPTGLKPGQELWIEVTVPPKGPPRPNQLALKENGAWHPLAFE
jgi:hypothetical protein